MLHITVDYISIIHPKEKKKKKDHISIDNVNVRFLSITGQKLEEE